MLFDLMFLRVHAPAGSVSVTPFRTDHDLIRLDPRLREPRGEELFGSPVRPSGVEITNAGLPGCVQNGVAMCFHRGNIVFVVQVFTMADIDVSGPPECREAEADSRYGESRSAEGMRGHLRKPFP